MTNYLILFAAVLILANIAFVISIIRKRNDVADIAWGLGFVAVAWLSYYLTDSANSRGILVNILITIWGLRLALHIFLRQRGHGEDFRYKAWRESWGKWFLVRSYFQVYILQGMLLFLISTPVIWANFRVAEFQVFDLIGLTLFLIGFFFEAVGDYQLTAFKKKEENKGRIIQTGLWKFTRHPNYFGEVVLWWGIFFFALSLPLGYVSISSPVLVTILLLFVSGIPMLEKKYENDPEFIEYKKRTSAFFPMPVKRG